MVKIITDTLSCTPKEFIAQHNIPEIPQVINFGNNSYVEGTDIDMPKFYDLFYNAKESPSTAAPPPIYYAEKYEAYLNEGVEEILVVSPSDQMSGTANSARVAAKEFPDANIRIYNTHTIGTAQGTLVQLATLMAQAGKTSSEIEEELTIYCGKSRCYFVVDTLEYLAKGGRIGGANYLIGSVLQIKPILEIKNGQIEAKEKARTKKRAVALLKELVLQDCAKNSNPHFAMMNSDAKEEAQTLADEIKQALGIEDIYITDLPPAITTHGGPGIIGVSFFTD